MGMCGEGCGQQTRWTHPFCLLYMHSRLEGFVAAVLFRVEYAVRTGLTKPSSTSQRCVWDVPAAERAPSDPIKLADQVWSKDQYFNQNDGGHSKSVRQLATAFSPLSKQQEDYVQEERIKDDLADLLRQHAPDSCFVQLYDKRPFPAPKHVDCPPCPKLVAQTLGHPCTPEELAEATVLTDKQKQDLNKITVCQSETREWFNQRSGRITASNFHRTCSRMVTLQRDSTADPSSLIKSLMGHNPEFAIKHGKSMEPHAKKAYTKIQKSKHSEFVSEDCGLLIHKTLPYIGASPDSLVSCCCGESKCQPRGICETKCPYTIRDQEPTSENWKPHFTQQDSLIKLSETSPYYTQVQGEMAVANVSFCDFFVFTHKGFHLERICFEREFWEKKEKLLVEFWYKYVSNELIFGSLSCTGTANEESAVLDHSYNSYTSDLAKVNTPSTSRFVNDSHSKTKRNPFSKPKLPMVYMCGKCGGDVIDDPDCDQDESVECIKCLLWYHTRCVQLANAGNVSGAVQWHCHQCFDV